MSEYKNKKNSFLLPLSLILIAAFSRLLPHPYNFSPVAAIALFGGALVGNKKLAFLIPLGALFLSDLCFSLFTAIPGFYGASQIINYMAFAMIVVLGMWIIKKVNFLNVITGAVSASILFFLVSNFGVWITASGVPPYTADWSGLLATYALGIPFLGNSLLGDLVYSGMLFGAYYLIKNVVLREKQLSQSI